MINVVAGTLLLVAAPSAFVGVTVVPGDRARVIPDQTVVVDGGRIVRMGPSNRVKVPAGATRIEGQGKFLMPGLVDMHGHLRPIAPDPTWESWLKLSVANGVTTLREMDGSKRHLEMRDRVLRGEVLGPRMYLCGPGFRRENTPAPAVAIEHVNKQKQWRYDAIKIYDGLSPDTYQAIVRTARQIRRPLFGHVPGEVGLRKVLAAGQKSIEHMDGYVEALAGDPVIPPRDPKNPRPSENDIFLAATPEVLDKVDESKIPQLVAATKRAGAVVVPSLVEFRALFNELKLESLRQLPELKYMPPSFVDLWLQQQRDQPPRDPEQLNKLMRLRDRIARQLAAQGLVVLGSDAPGRFAVPGFALRHEAEAMVQLGMTPWQVLEAATSRPARVLGLADTGTVAVGKRADLVLVDGNPLDDVANMFRSSGVMVNGRWLARAELDAMLAEIVRMMFFPPVAEVKDLPIPAQQAAALAGNYEFAGLKVTMGVDLEKGALLLGNRDPRRPEKARLQAQGDGRYMIPELKATVRFDMKDGKAAGMTLSIPGLYLDEKGSRVAPP